MKSFRDILALTLCALIACAPATAVEVIADDAADVFAISGAVILDGSFSEARQAAICDNCHWRVVPICDPGTLDDRRGCVAQCPVTTRTAEVWRADAPAPPPLGDPLWSYRGVTCLGTDPIPASSAASIARDTAMRAIPPLLPLSRPPGVTLTGLPTLFMTRQPRAFSTDGIAVAGEQVYVRATPTWAWDFGHGSILTTTDPGAEWPSGRVRHTYPRRGIYRVKVTATWHAVYDVRGITDLPVDGVITQSAWFDLRVREARRFLRTPGV